MSGSRIHTSRFGWLKTQPGLQLACFLILTGQGFSAFAGTAGIHTSWLWHLHQPIYWPNHRISNTNHYEAAWDTIQQQDLGRGHPTPEVLRNIFGLDDRVNAYQGRPRDSLATISSHLNSGSQVSYSGALIENVQSLGAAGQLGYSSTWFNGNRTARNWTTTSGKPRFDLVHFTYHHSLAPLLSDETLEMELRIHRRQMEIFWGTNPPVSRGFFPTETCFSEQLIPILRKVGIDWSIIANNHLARSCADFPVVVGSGGENCDLPNRADQLNPPQGAANYQRVTIDRGCAPTQVMPFGFQVHYARHVDPETGAESKLIVVPSDQALGWKDSYSSWDLNLLNELNARNDPAKPSLALFAHDGDNAWSGGYSYYMEWVNNYASQAAQRGYELTTIEQFLHEFPPGTNDIVHVEDGGWVYADSDFGSPMFINWHWPPSYSSGGVNVVDPSLGVSDKADNWRVIIATENRVKTAQQISGITPRIDQVRDPGGFATSPNTVELGWHFYLGGLDSGFVYYGCLGDMCQRTATAQSNAVRNVNGILSGNPSADDTAPTLFLPQRHPWNPGGQNYGAQYGYKLTTPTNSDFWVWTYGYDVSGITNVALKFRNNGTNAPTQDQFKTYAGGPLAGPWNTIPMTKRIAAPVTGVTPQYIADYYYARVMGITNSYVDYYVSATDALGNTFKSQIQHVWVGTGQGNPGNPPNTNGCSGRVCVLPAQPVAGAPVMIQFYPSGGPLANAGAVKIHLGWNNWNTVINPDASMSFNAGSNRWEHSIAAPANATQLDCVFNDGAGIWDNNNGADWHFTVTSNNVPQPPAYPPFVLDGQLDFPQYAFSSNALGLCAALRGTKLYVAARSPGTTGPNDHFIFVSDQLLPDATASAPWIKSGKLAVATTKPFLGTESQNTYISWHNLSSGAVAFKSGSTFGYMEGTIDLVVAFGAMPESIYLCAAAYATADGGALVSQAPLGSGPDIETNEFFGIPLIALKDHNADGIFDRLDPACDFALTGATLSSNSLAVSWSSMPGRAYRLNYRASLTNPWAVLPNSAITAGAFQTTLWYSEPRTNLYRFYRVELLP